MAVLPSPMGQPMIVIRGRTYRFEQKCDGEWIPVSPAEFSGVSTEVVISSPQFTHRGTLCRAIEVFREAA
jgi:hypothetical protein